MMLRNSIEIKNQEDLDQHFIWHKQQQENISNAIDEILEKCTETISPEYQKSLEILQNLRDEKEVDCYPLEISYGKITMYVNHEGSCMSNIQYCPFCGVHFILASQKNQKVNT